MLIQRPYFVDLLITEFKYLKFLTSKGHKKHSMISRQRAAKLFLMFSALFICCNWSDTNSDLPDVKKSHQEGDLMHTAGMLDQHRTTK